MSIFIFLIGLAIGSFLNVMALRLLNDEDFMLERSKCPHCDGKIAWYDNIPVLSYLLLRGKCRRCAGKISIQYPTVELLTGVLFLLLWENWGASLKTFFFMFLTANLIVILITDLREKYIFDINSVPLIPLGLAYNFFCEGGQEMFISAVIGAIAGAAFFEIFSRLGLLLVGEYAFGGGDSILGAALGAWLGWKFLIAVLLISFIAQMLFGMPIILYNMYKHKEYKSLFAMGGLILSLILSASSRYLVLAGLPLVAVGIILASFVLAGACVYIVFKRMKEAHSYTFLPFGPPLIIAGFIVMFLPETVSAYLPF